MIYMESIILIDEPGLAEYHGPKRFRRELAPRRGRDRAHAFSDPPDPHAAWMNTRPGGLPPKRTKKHPGAGGRSPRFDGASTRSNRRGSVIASIRGERGPYGGQKSVPLSLNLFSSNTLPVVEPFTPQTFLRMWFSSNVLPTGVPGSPRLIPAELFVTEFPSMTFPVAVSLTWIPRLPPSSAPSPETLLFSTTFPDDVFEPTVRSRTPFMYQQRRVSPILIVIY